MEVLAYRQLFPMNYLDAEIMLYYSQDPVPSTKQDLCLGAARAQEELSVA